MSGAKTRIILNDEKVCQIGILSLSGDTYISELGRLKYTTNQASEYEARSIPDVEYITGITNTINNRVNTIENLYVSGGTNGICKSGKNLKLGGNLTENTTISGNFSLNLCNGVNLNTQTGYSISGNTILRNSQRTISSIYLGYHNCSNGTGANNIGIGSCVLSATTIGYNNIGIGNKVLNNNIGGYDNIGIGPNVLSLTTGSVNNIGIGNNTMNKLTSGVNNIGLGCNVMSSCSVTGCDNIGIGTDVLKNINNGCFNTSIGGASLNSLTSGCNNVAIGYNNLINVTSGSTNIGIGICNGLNTNGSRNIYIGLNAGNNTTGSDKLYVSNSDACNLIYGDFVNNFVTLPTLKLCTTPINGASNDYILVWNNSDKSVKKILSSTILANGITGSTNGITQVLQKVKLGGNLTEDTTIGLTQKNLSFSGTYLNNIFLDKSPANSGGFTSRYTASSGGTDVISEIKNEYDNVNLSVRNPNTPFECQAIDLSLLNGMRVIDTANCKGLVYNADYSNNFTNESLVTKRFVTGQTTTAGIQYAANGLTKLGSTVVLGGELTGDTTIYGCNRNFGLGYFNNYLSGFRVYANDVCQYGLDEYTICSVNQINLMSDDDITLKGGSVSVCALANYNTDYSNSYTARSLVDKAFVTGLTNNINLDITYLSGVTDNIIQDIIYVSGVTSGNTAEISNIHQDITGLNHTLSGHTGNTTIHHTPEEIKTIIGIDTVSGSSSIFLNKKGDFINIPVVGNGSSSNVYFTTLDSEETGYKLLSYTLEPTETTLSATFSNTTHLVQKYLYPQGVATSLLPAGTYDFNFYTSSNKAGSSIVIEFFKRTVGDVDTVLFSGTSTQEITSTINRISIILSEIGYPVDPTDRIGINVYFKSSNNNTTMNLIIGDGRGAYWKGTAMPRHSDIRDKNGEQSFQHIDNGVTASGITTNDKFTIYSSSLGKYISVDRNTYLSWLSNLYVPVVNGSTDNAIVRFDGTTGKLIQNSGIIVDDSGYMGFGITPTAQITQTSTAALESAPLGTELLTSSNWTTTGWTGDFVNGFTHTTGNVTPLTNTLAALNATLYQIAFTVTNRTAGNFTVTFGNETSNRTFTTSNAWGVKTTGTGTLSITPTTDFNGTIVISIKRITGTYNATYQILDSAGINTLEIRSSLNTLNNTFIGKGAGSYNTTGYNNSAQGVYALQNNTTGNNNSAQGVYALQNNTTGSYNSAQGYAALQNNTTGNFNSAQGFSALRDNTTGNYNSAQGLSALQNNKTGSYNSAQGYAALQNNTTGHFNSAQGYAALFSNTTGSNNSAQGVFALSNNTTGYNNSAQGFNALYSNTTGYNNSAQGLNALYSNTTGYNNSAQGINAGRYLADGVTANQTSNNSVFLGSNTKSKQTGQTNEIVIGNDAIGNGSNTVTLGHTTVTDTYLRGNIALTTPPISGLNTDSILVYNTSDCYVKSISTSDVLSSAILTANNGLTKSGQNVHLGGILTGNTGISGAYTMGFNNTYLNLTGTSGVYISGPTKLLSTPANGVGSDSILVWNSTDKCIKSISCSTINAGNITTANNGLTKSGQNVRLGGTLTGNTSINGGGYSFNLGVLNNCLGSFTVCSSSITVNPTGNGEIIPTGSLTLGGSSVVLNNFASYNNNYSGSFTKYSLVDKNYVTGLTSTLGIQTANNGLTKSGLNVRLGGSLTGNTGINGSYTMGFNNCMLNLTGTSGVHISGPTKLMSAPTAGVGTDGILVWNSTDKCVKTLTCACLNAGNVTTANNGLTKSGQNVRLGGTLTGGTTINGGGFDFNLGINGSLVNNYNVCSTNSLICSSGNANIFGNSITLKGGSINSCGLINYNIDYSGSYTTRSLVDKGYVTGLTSNINTCLNTINSLYLTGATNGLSLASKKVKLGGTLTEATTINGGSYALNLGALNNCLGTLTICSTSTSIIPTGALTLGGGSISLNNFASYNNNYSSSFTKYSLVDKNYVTGITSTLGIQTANNGLTKSGLNVRLGGVLTGNTGISGAYTMGFNNTYLNLTGTSGVYISGPTKLLSTPASGVGTDSILVWNSTDKCVKSLTCACLNASNIQTANNGLTKSGQNVRLGGTLTGNTIIAGAAHDFTLGCNTSLINNYNVCTCNSLVCSSGNANIFSDGVLTLKGATINSCNLISYYSDYSASYTNRSLVDKEYVDSVATGLDVKVAVKVATIGNITLSGLQTIDGIALSAGDRVLVKNQTTQWRNGIYDAASGTWLRSSDYDFSITSEINNGDLISVLSGDTNANSIWALTSSNPIISGTTNLVFTKFMQQSGVVSGNGICVTNSGINKEISVKLDTNSGLQFNSNNLSVNWNNYRAGLCVNNYKVDLRVSRCTATGSEIPVAINTGGTNTLYIDSACINTVLGNPITTANNGLTKSGQNVRLGGSLTGNTIIAGAAHDFTLGCNTSLINNYYVCSTTNTQCATGNINILSSGVLSLKGTAINACALANYNTDYSGSYTNRSLVDKGYVTGLTSNINTCLNTINSLYLTGATNGLSLASKKIKLGGTLTEATTINGGGYGLNLGALNNCLGALIMCSTSASIIPTGALTLGGGSISLNNFASYNNNYSGSFTKYSLVDKNYVTGLTSSLGVQTANNGLTKSGLNVRLGGSLTGDTGVNGLYTMGFNNTYLNLTGTSGVYISGPTKLLSTPATGVGTDNVLVWNSTDKCVKSISCSCINASNIQTANNGLTKSGQNVRLGGSLTGNTIIAGAAHDFTLGCNSSLINNYYVCSTTNTQCATGNINIFSGGVLSLKGTSVCVCALSNYNSDYSGSYTARSLVDKGYVTGLTNTINSCLNTINSLYLTGATNGLSLSAKKIKLGGTLTEATTINGGGYALNLGLLNNCLGAFTVCSSSSSIIPTGTLTLGGSSITLNQFASYNSNYSSSFTKYSLVDKNYVTGVTSSLGVQTANNGLTKSGLNVRLGGSLTGNTGVNGAYTMGFNNTILNLTGSTCVNISGPTKLLSTPSSGVGTDSVLVWNSTDKSIKSITCACINAGNITTANNGLNKVGQNVRLGGSLTGDTGVNGAYSMGFNNSYLNLTGSTCVNISGPTKLLSTPSTGANTDDFLVWNSTDKCVKSINVPGGIVNTITGLTSQISNKFTFSGDTFGNKKTIGSIDNQDFGIITNNTERLTVLKNGNVGIDTNVPTNKLDVNGTINTNIGYNITKVTKPTAPTYTLQSGGNIEVGEYYYFITYITAIGETNAGSTMKAIVTEGNNTVVLTIPVSTDPLVIGRKIYRTKKNLTYDNEFYLATISNNTTTTYTDTASDSTLTGAGLQYYRVNSTVKNISVDNVQAMIIDPNLTTLGINAGRNLLGSYSPVRTVLIGNGAGSNLTTGAANVVVGVAFGTATTASSSTIIGDLAGYNITTGGGNTIIGSQAGRNITTGASNIIIGINAGSRIADNTSLTTPDNSIYIGIDTKGYSNSSNNEIVIGYNAIGNGSNTATLGHTTVTDTYLRGRVHTNSSMQIGDDTAVASANKVGTIRQRDVNNLTLLEFARNNNGVYEWEKINDKLNLDQSTPQTIQGLLQNQSTAALESAPLGSELLTSSNWTTTGWTGDFATGFTHTTGNVTPLTNTLAALNATLYQITYTITNRTAGSVNITFGGVSTGAVTSSGAIGNRTASTGTFSIVPTTDFNGTIVISIKRITGTYTPSYQILDSAGISTLEIRSSLNTLNNTFIGKGAGGYNTTGYQNSAQGVYALYYNTTGYQNSAQGSNALYSNTTGYHNSAQGYNALRNNTTGFQNSAQGVYALLNNTTGSNNSAQGVYALYYNTTGFHNSAQGYAALFSNTTGSYNSAQGVYALYYNTTGSNNSAQGYGALYSNTIGSNNSAQGYAALYFNTTGYNNSAQGYYALASNTTGSQNSAQGVQALRGNTTGSNNSAQGYYAGRYLADGVTANQNSNNSVFLGSNTKSKQANQTNEIVIGNDAIGNGSNSVTLGHTTVTDTYLRGNIHLETPPISGNTGDGVLVWNSTDNMVKLVSNSIITGGTISNANNGLTKSGSNVRLGGTLTGNTSITGAYTMGFSNSYLNLTGSTCVNISGPTKLLSTPSSGAGTDSILVWNSTDKTIKTITCACINSGNITTANNGLTKSGQNVRLGGTLTGNTTINTSTSSFNMYGNGLYDTCTCVINSCAGNGGSVYTQICQTNSLLYLNHCNVSQSKYSNISLCNGEIKQVSSLNNCITASNCISGAVVNTGTTGYDITPIYSKLYFGTTAYQAVCNDGTSDIYGLNGVNITTPSSNGIILTGTLKLNTIPTTGTNTDSVLVYNSTDKCVKSLGFSEFGDKNNIYSMSVIDSATGLTNSSPYVILVNHTLPVTIDLPASPTNGRVFKIKDVSTTGAFTNNVTIGRNGKLIDRQTNNGSINTDSGAVELIYNATLGSWFSLSFIN